MQLCLPCMGNEKHQASTSRHASLSSRIHACCAPQNRKNTPERLELMKYNPNLSECSAGWQTHSCTWDIDSSIGGLMGASE